MADIASKLLALAVGGHHGLFDCVDSGAKSGFLHRLPREGTGYEEAVSGFFRTCAGKEEVFCLVQKAQAGVD